MSEAPEHQGGGGYGPFHNGHGQPPAPEQQASQPVPQHAASPQPTPTPPPEAWSLFPDGGPGSPSWQPRIQPIPKPPRGPVIRAALLGLLAGLLIFGATGYLVGHQTRPAPAAAPKRVASSSSGLPVLPLFEHAQLELNKPKFTSALTPIANSWMPWITGCARSGDKDGPHLGDGEDTRVTCHFSNATINFVVYKSTDERDKAYTKFLAQNIDAKQLTPGVGEPTTKKTTSGAVNGRYIEFAYKTSGDGNGKPVCGVWWSDANAPIAAYLLTYWTDGLGESWEPLRDVWRRYS